MIVNTVVFTRASLGGDDGDVAIVLGAFGAGSMIVAFVLPRLLEVFPERLVMAAGAWLTAVLFTVLGVILSNMAVLEGPASWALLLVGWFLAGIGFSAVLTPVGRLLRKSVGAPDLPAIFAAQFALTHVCWLVTYPMAGYLGGLLGLPATMLVMGGVAWCGVGLGYWCWPRNLPGSVEHWHGDLASDHPHLPQGASTGHEGRMHSHPIVIDDLHPRWPSGKD
ncbi:MAG: MFS transporter [Rhodospirillaceae bacterium]|nr:MFS transporter [Rhodospirillaceae bacterium]